MTTRKQYLSLSFVVALCVLCGAGCMTALHRQAPPDLLPVREGIATTNDTETVAWLRYGAALNRQFNVTATEPIADAAIGSLIALASAVAGWTARHRTPTQKPPPSA